ncbi:hypothetical protein SAMD00019534_074180 [Acytostelium subglobosum LB1]|uniref:hypothetical protein n=1 Tax=Acytostelium subglobosum LB1 TaxID=1410327 RepID=UPI000644964E|nr:hypothetical protein SAMD00019534_074180 [Acytostelium subglobosum LB1]GAM24243.1 hypothetical protein SAMD00019534_074180 [Acytostelium subglobosum LB1]|eukprot:XP_012752569.1 hypothetical protein SAMD00019534_074180 [Acytostelium subglobosum LB1]
MFRQQQQQQYMSAQNQMALSSVTSLISPESSPLLVSSRQQQQQQQQLPTMSKHQQQQNEVNNREMEYAMMRTRPIQPYPTKSTSPTNFHDVQQPQQHLIKNGHNNNNPFDMLHHHIHKLSESNPKIPLPHTEQHESGHSSPSHSPHQLPQPQTQQHPRQIATEHPHHLANSKKRSYDFVGSVQNLLTEMHQQPQGTGPSAAPPASSENTSPTLQSNLSEYQERIQQQRHVIKDLQTKNTMLERQAESYRNELSQFKALMAQSIVGILQANDHMLKQQQSIMIQSPPQQQPRTPQQQQQSPKSKQNIRASTPPLAYPSVLQTTGPVTDGHLQHHQQLQQQQQQLQQFMVFETSAMHPSKKVKSSVQQQTHHIHPNNYNNISKRVQAA